jgi:hypothetical protein
MQNSKFSLKMKLRLAPNVHLLQRSKTEIQIGLSPTNCVRLPSQFRMVITKSDGSNSVEQLLNVAKSTGFDYISALNTLKLLFDRQLLICEIAELKSSTKNQESHLRDAHRSTYISQTSVANRTRAHITIAGAGRLGMTIGLLLGNSGFSNLRILDDNPVSTSDLIPWGASRVDVGQRREQVAQMILERIHPGQLKSVRQSETRAKPNLIIYAPDPIADFPWLDPQLADGAVASDIPFLVAATSPAQSLASSIQVPGINACLRCFHLNQSDRDSAWPQLISQLIGIKAPDITPTDLILRTAFFTFNKVCEWIDLKPEVESNWYLITARAEQKLTVLPHAQCGCQWNLAKNQVS